MAEVPLALRAPAGATLSAAQVQGVIEQACPAEEYRDQRVLLIIPDGTRTAPIGLLFSELHRHLGPLTLAFDILVALGTHPPMSEPAILNRLEITAKERRGRFSRVRFFNHAWDNPAALTEIGTLSASDIHTLTGGLFALDVPVEINRMLFDYDRIIIVGPVFA